MCQYQHGVILNVGLDCEVNRRPLDTKAEHPSRLQSDQPLYNNLQVQYQKYTNHVFQRSAISYIFQKLFTQVNSRILKKTWAELEKLEQTWKLEKGITWTMQWNFCMYLISFFLALNDFRNSSSSFVKLSLVRIVDKLTINYKS